MDELIGAMLLRQTHLGAGFMSDADVLRNSLRTQMFSLQGLLNYLEGREQFAPSDYVYCQANLHEILKHLKRLERIANSGTADSGPQRFTS